VKIKENINYPELQGYIMKNYGSLLIELFKFGELNLDPNKEYCYPAYASIVITSYVILRDCITEDTKKLQNEARSSIRFIRKHFRTIFKSQTREVENYYRKLLKQTSTMKDIDESRSYYVLKEIQKKCLEE